MAFTSGFFNSQNHDRTYGGGGGGGYGANGGNGGDSFAINQLGDSYGSGGGGGYGPNGYGVPNSQKGTNGICIVRWSVIN